MENIINEVKAERVRQNKKWGEQNHKPIEWIAILSEEVGEASREAVDHHFENGLDHFKRHEKAESILQVQKARLNSYRKELIEVAAVAIQMIECLDRNENNVARSTDGIQLEIEFPA